MDILFLIIVGILFFIYFGYPLSLLLLASTSSRPTKKGPFQPTVTILIAARNEQETIAKTVQNKLELDYPRDKLQILVISDASTDNTDRIVRSFGSDKVQLLRMEQRSGKTCALNAAIPYAVGDILVTSDANSLYMPDALAKLVENFTDSEVGYVTGRLCHEAVDATSVSNGARKYLNYEERIRRLESAIGSLVGVNGGIDAMRKSLWTEDPPHFMQDFSWPLKVVAKGYRVVYEENAVMHESPLIDATDEFRMRVRLTLGTLPVLWAMRHMLRPKHGIFALQLLFHKVLRYVAGFLQIAAFIINLILAQNSGLFAALLFLQIAFYLFAIIGGVLHYIGKHNRLFESPFYFCLGNAAATFGILRYLRGQTAAVWEPRKGC